MSRIVFITILIFAFCPGVSAQADKDVCPTIKISVSDFLDVNKTEFAAAEVGKEIEKYNVGYVWTIERGKILEGQGTKKIKILRETTDRVNIILKITGLPSNCLDIDQAAISTIDRKTYPPVDTFDKRSLKDEEARFDNFFIIVSKDDYHQAVVIFELDKKESEAEKRRRLKEISRHFNLGKIDKFPFTFIVYKEEKEFTAFHLFPKNKNWDNFLSLEDKDYKVIKSEEFEPKKIDELFPKK